MGKRQINIRDVPGEIFEWIERERQAKRVSQKEFLLKVLRNAASQAAPDKAESPSSAFCRMTMVYWKSKKFWLGKLLEHPEIMTQGRTLEELERNIREAYMLVALGDAPDDYRVREVVMT